MECAIVGLGQSTATSLIENEIKIETSFLLKFLWSERLFLNTIKVHNLNNQFQKNEINVVSLVRTLRDIKCQIPFLTQFKDWDIEYIEKMKYAVGSLMMKSTVVQLHTSSNTLTERSISSKFIAQRLFTKFTWNFPVNAPIMVLCSKSLTHVSLHRYFKDGFISPDLPGLKATVWTVPPCTKSTKTVLIIGNNWSKNNLNFIINL